VQASLTPANEVDKPLLPAVATIPVAQILYQIFK
jgi:hypothetical protein